MPGSCGRIGGGVAGEAPASRARIARATDADRAAVMAMAKADHAESAPGDLAFSQAKYNALMDRSLEEPGRCLLIKAEKAAEILGALYLTLGEYIVSEDGLIGSVTVIYTRPDLRATLLGGKVALKLIKSGIRWAEAQGASRTLFHVTSGIHPARSDGGGAIRSFSGRFVLQSLPQEISHA